MDFDFLARVGVLAAVIHCGAHGHREGNVVLDLLRTPVMRLQKVVHDFHFLFSAAGKVRNEERNQVLFLADLLVASVEHFHKRFELAGLSFAHEIQNARMQMFRRDFEMSGNMIPDDLKGQLRLAEREIQAHAGIQEHFPDAR